MMGFLSATQEGQKKNRMSLWMESLPPRGPSGYLWDWLIEIGLGSELTWSEVKSWSELTGIEPTREECILLTRLSKDWLSERYRGSDKHATPCWIPEG